MSEFSRSDPEKIIIMLSYIYILTRRHAENFSRNCLPEWLTSDRFFARHYYLRMCRNVLGPIREIYHNIKNHLHSNPRACRELYFSEISSRIFLGSVSFARNLLSWICRHLLAPIRVCGKRNIYILTRRHAENFSRNVHRDHEVLAFH